MHTGTSQLKTARGSPLLVHCQVCHVMMACVRLAVRLFRAQEAESPVLSRTLHGICAAALNILENTRQEVQSITALLAQTGCLRPAQQTK